MRGRHLQPLARHCPLALGVLLAACAAQPTPCRTPAHCSAGLECLANQCRPAGAEPVAADSERVVLLPRQTWHSPGSHAEPALYLDFSAPSASYELRSAFLLLPEAATALSSARQVHVEVRATTLRAGAPANEADYDSQTSGPAALGLASAGAPVRVDVTHLAADALSSGQPFAWLLQARVADRPVHLTALPEPQARLELYVAPAAQAARSTP